MTQLRLIHLDLQLPPKAVDRTSCNIKEIATSANSSLKILIYLPFFNPCLAIYAEDEWNLLYVAVTRAKKCLLMTKSLEYVLTLAGVS